MDKNNAIADATTKALINTLTADGIQVPDRILKDLVELEAATNQRVIKITAGLTSVRYIPDGPFPLGSDNDQWRWQSLRLCGDLFTNPKYKNWPRVKEIPPEPCYILHLSQNGITAEAWLKQHGYIATSSQAFRCTLQEIK